ALPRCLPACFRRPSCCCSLLFRCAPGWLPPALLPGISGVSCRPKARGLTALAISAAHWLRWATTGCASVRISGECA
ncbi:hypothetical protein GGI11_009292, partial [Coemansia sp. RSA 2049]